VRRGGTPARCVARTPALLLMLAAGLLVLMFIHITGALTLLGARGTLSGRS
jgi:hypothetical protein